MKRKCQKTELCGRCRSAQEIRGPRPAATPVFGTSLAESHFVKYAESQLVIYYRYSTQMNVECMLNLNPSI